MRIKLDVEINVGETSGMSQEEVERFLRDFVDYSIDRNILESLDKELDLIDIFRVHVSINP